MNCIRVVAMATEVAPIAAVGFALYYFWDAFPANLFIVPVLFLIACKMWKENREFRNRIFRNLGG